ncbi:MAG TPA: beta-ketoacyl synthase N-terminal-like domain-containing protein [Streptosporangiaceae bacterium]|jgi:3-oxoacyl-[acyl-carrier-protein] synthase II
MTAAAQVTGTGLALAESCPPGRLADLMPGGAGWSVTEAHLSRRGMRFKDRASRLALCAADAALRQAGYLDDGGYAGPAARTAVLVSSDLGCLDNVCGAIDVISAGSSSGLSPMGLPHTAPNMVAGWIAIEYGLKGPNLTICNGITGGLDALFWGTSLIAADRAEVVLVVGVEPDGPAVRRLLTEDGAASWLDGAAAVVLEPESRPDRRRAPRVELTGYARARSLASAVRDVPSARAGQWLVTGPGLPPPPGVPVLDLSAQIGRCSGALGVLQCLAAVGILERDGTGAVLAACGESAGGPAAALVINAPPADEAPPADDMPAGPAADGGGA